MEKSNWNIDQMLHWLDIKIEREDQDIAKQKKADGRGFPVLFRVECGEPV
ncbi:hypothetical protein ACIXFQ_11095 [Bacteroides fragilis]